MTGVQTCALPILAVQHGSSDPQASQGPWSIDILEVRPHLYRGRLVSALARDAAAGAERTSEMARRHPEIGRASCRDRVCQSVLSTGVAVTFKKITKTSTHSIIDKQAIP